MSSFLRSSFLRLQEFPALLGPAGLPAGAGGLGCEHPGRLPAGNVTPAGELRAVSLRDTGRVS